jgi:hypothetical protein
MRLESRPHNRQPTPKKKIPGRPVGIGHTGGLLPLPPLRARLATDEDAVLTFREWCALNGIGERTGRRILAEPGGPVITQLSDKRIGISRRNNRTWLESRARGAE